LIGACAARPPAAHSEHDHHLAPSAAASSPPPLPSADHPHHHGDHHHADHEHAGPAHEHAGPAHDHADHAHDQPPTADHRFEDPKYWSKVFDDPKRDEWQRPGELVRALAIAQNETIVDLGAGTGYMVPHLSRAVPKGRVLAIDVEPGLLRHIDERVKKVGLTNVTTRLATKSDPNLVEKVDLVLLVDAYHHIGGRTAYFRRVAERLTPGGRVVIVDFRLGKLPVGPGDDHKLAPEVVTREMTAGGYRLCESWDKLPYQYVLIFALRCAAPAR
jgi:SAM-dependent methyltransferase